MSVSLTGKDKAARVPLGYFREAGQGRRRLAWAVFGLLVVSGVAVVATGQWKLWAMPGKVHSVHAAWEKDCTVCHGDPLQPTGSRNVLHKLTGTGLASDALCKNCHQGPHHHATEIAGEAGSCASCHVEHRGREVSLVRNPDSRCTSCHANLSGHVTDEKTDFANKITRFDRDHPQFRLGSKGKRQDLGKARDPSKLRFNHKVHLTAGIRYSEKDARGWTLGQIPDAKTRQRYREQQPEGQRSDADLVQLDCASCHQTDNTDVPRRATPVRAAGDLVLPVTYDLHCKACHPLTFDPAMPRAEVPHHLQPGEVNRFLRGVYTDREITDPRVRKQFTDWPLPGKNLPRLELEKIKKKVESEVAAIEALFYPEQLGRAEKYVYSGKTTCGLCHQFDRKEGNLIPARIAPPNVPEVWYQHAKFSHRAHRAVDCRQCHAGATQSEVNTDVLLPGVDNCKTCHAAQHTDQGQPRGGVRQDCVTCHRYHNGDRPLGGLGAGVRGVPVRRGLEEFLLGR